MQKDHADSGKNSVMRAKCRKWIRKRGEKGFFLDDIYGENWIIRDFAYRMQRRKPLKGFKSVIVMWKVQIQLEWLNVLVRMNDDDNAVYIRYNTNKRR